MLLGNGLPLVEEPFWSSLLAILLLLGMAAFLGTVAEHLRQSAIVGYLVAGTLIGPNGLRWIADPQPLGQLAELGVALLLFAIGLEFSIQELLRLGRVALWAGAAQVLVTLAVVTGVGSFAVPWKTAFVLACMVTMSSTACVLRVLADRAELELPSGRLSLAILLFQDAAVVPLMLLVSLMGRSGSLQSALQQLGLVVLTGGILVLVLHGLFSYLAPPLFALQARFRNRDLPILLAVALALAAAWLAHRAGFSPAMGAFIAGALLGVSPFANQIRADVGPIKTTLVTLFFASVGMLGDPVWLVRNAGWVAAAVVLVLLVKIVLTSTVACWAGARVRFAVATGISLAQIGEFSLVLATLAYHDRAGGGLLNEHLFRTMISATILTLLLTPYMMAVAGPVSVWSENRIESWLPVLRRVLTLWRRVRRPRPSVSTPGPTVQEGSAARSTHDEGLQAASQPVSEGGTAVGQPCTADLALSTQENDRSPISTCPLILIIGFGPAGQRVAEDLMARHKSELVVVDLNPENVATARRYGLRTVLGDATQRDILEHAGVRRAAAVVVTVPTPQAARMIIQLVRHESPGAMIFARSRYHVYRWALLHAGAHVVVDEEDGLGHQLAEQVLRAFHEPTTDN